MCVSVFKSLEGNSLCWYQSRAANSGVCSCPLSVWKMKLFSIAASHIPVALWLCKGLSGLLLCCMEYTSQPYDKEKVSLYWYCDISICCEKPFCIPQTSFLGVTLPSFHLRCVLALTSWWQVYCKHLKYGCQVSLCPLQCWTLLKLSWDISRLLWSSARREALLVGLEELVGGLYYVGPTWVGSRWISY